MKKALLGLAFLIPFSVFAQGYNAVKVVSVVDGDTLVVDHSGGKINVRLAGIDAPEVKHNNNQSNQPYGVESTKALASKVDGKLVDLSCDGQSYNRKVCTVFLKGENINEWLVVNGHAWAYDRYDKTGRYQALEDQARTKKVGIWSLPERQHINPKNWRREYK